jgi:dipeptidyl aminopeptidase/acylaminoacyl peptidase
LEGVDFDWALGKERQTKMDTWVCELASGKESLGVPEDVGAHALWDVNAHSPVDIYDPQKPGISRDRTSLAISQARTSPNGKLVAYRWQPPWGEQPSHPSAYTSLFVRPNKGGKEINLAAAFWSIGDFWWSADGSQVYFWGRLLDNIPSNLYVVPSHGGTPREVAHMGASFGASSVDANVTLVAGVKQTTTTPYEVAIVDLKSGEIRTLANVNPEFANIRLSPATQINWKNKYGDSRYGYLLKPLDYEPGKRYPLIITTYANGPEGFRRGAVGDEYPIQVFAARGFAVLDVELVPFYGYKSGDFESFLWSYYAPIADFEAAIKIVVDMGVVDRSRKGISGLSYGARLTSFAISHSDLFQAAIVSGPNGDDPFFYYLDDPFQMKAGFGAGALGWPEGETSKKWHQLSPALNAASVKAPLLVNSADSELLAGMQFYTSLLQLGKAIEVFIYPDEEHEKNQPKHRYEIYQRNVDWFDFWLNGREDAEPAKAEQYKRWRKLQKMQQENESKMAAPQNASN